MGVLVFSHHHYKTKASKERSISNLKGGWNKGLSKYGHRKCPCGNDILLSYATRKYCSRECYFKYRANYFVPHGPKKSNWRKGHKPWNTGKHLPLVLRRKLSKIHVRNIELGRELPFNGVDFTANYMPNNYSHYERAYEDYLISKGLVKGVDFSHNVKLGRYVVDFLFPYAHHIVEIDGSYHELRRYEDKMRDKYLKKLGNIVLHVPTIEVRGICGTVGVV